MFIEKRGNHGKEKSVLIIMIEGGIGDHVMATPLLRGLRRKYPKDKWYIVLIAMYHEVFGYQDPDYMDGDHFVCMNPHIDHLYSMRIQSNFYTEWARNADVTLRRNPYIESPQRLGSIHFAEAWCVIHDVDFDHIALDYHLTAEEDFKASQLFKMFENPVVVIQPFGGNDPLDNVKATGNKDWEIFKWQELVNWIVNRGYDVVQIGQLGEPIFDGVFSLVGHTDIREVAAVVKHSDFFISIDSFVPHLAKAIGKLGIVLWGRTNPFRVGYMENYNVFKMHSCPEIFCGRPEGALFDSSPMHPYFTPWQCPHRSCMKSIQIQDVCKGIGTIEKTLRLDPATYLRPL